MTDYFELLTPPPYSPVDHVAEIMNWPPRYSEDPSTWLSNSHRDYRGFAWVQVPPNKQTPPETTPLPPVAPFRFPLAHHEEYPFFGSSPKRLSGAAAEQRRSSSQHVEGEEEGTRARRAGGSRAVVVEGGSSHEEEERQQETEKRWMGIEPPSHRSYTPTVRLPPAGIPSPQQHRQLGRSFRTVKTAVLPTGQCCFADDVNDEPLDFSSLQTPQHPATPTSAGRALQLLVEPPAPPSSSSRSVVYSPLVPCAGRRAGGFTRQPLPPFAYPPTSSYAELKEQIKLHVHARSPRSRRRYLPQERFGGRRAANTGMPGVVGERLGIAGGQLTYDTTYSRSFTPPRTQQRAGGGARWGGGTGGVGGRYSWWRNGDWNNGGWQNGATAEPRGREESVKEDRRERSGPAGKSKAEGGGGAVRTAADGVKRKDVVERGSQTRETSLAEVYGGYAPTTVCGCCVAAHDRAGGYRW
eukprot:GHVS01026805.1.p1 GENE.GHVS01026805.1~~GHVS01026805.1.p1  ORF type:complete len:467 (+),score=107.48 GHVS01026805.1:1234-2634(+)